MSIKYLFDGLKQFGKKEYFGRNGEEQLIFTNDKLVLEIINCDGNLDLAIENGGKKTNYKDSTFLSFNQIEQIKSIINSVMPLKIKCRSLANLLITIFS